MLQLTQLAIEGSIDVYYGDESFFCLNPNVQYAWQKKEYIKIVPKRSTTIKIFGLISREKGELHTFESFNNINSDFIIQCINEFITKITKKTIIVLDNASTHCSKKMKEQLEIWDTIHDLHIFYLPKYSPHLNLIETLWRKIKYEWLKPNDYKNTEVLSKALSKIFKNYGTDFNINFSAFTGAKSVS